MKRTSRPQCILCQNLFSYDLTWQQIFSFKTIQPPSVCPECQSSFISIQSRGQTCYACGRVLDESDDYHHAYQLISRQEEYCYDCYRWLKEYPLCLVKNLSLFEYNDFFKNWIYRYKFQGDCRLAEVMIQPLQKIYKAFPQTLWLVLPSSLDSLKKRRFHPTGYLLDKAGISYICPLSYVGDGIRQAQKNRKERLKFSHPFAWKGLAISGANLENIRSLMVFDDIYTTGSTMIQAKLEILKNTSLVSEGKIELKSLTLARNSLIEKRCSAFNNFRHMV